MKIDNVKFTGFLTVLILTLTLLSATSSAQQLGKLALSYKFENTSMTNIQDFSGNNHTGINNNVTKNVTGLFGKAVNFSGTGNITTNNSPDFVVSDDQDVLICGIVKVPERDRVQMIMDKDSGAPDGYQSRIDVGERVDFVVDRSDFIILDGQSTVNNGLFHHFCHISRGINRTKQTNATQFINNQFDNEINTSEGGMGGNDDLLFGQDYDANRSYDGKLDEFCMWTGRKLNLSNVSEYHFNNGCPDLITQTTTNQTNQTLECTEFSACIDGSKECEETNIQSNETEKDELDKQCVSLFTENFNLIIGLLALAISLIFMGFRFREKVLGIIGSFIGFFISMGILHRWLYQSMIGIVFFIAIGFLFAVKGRNR